MADKNNTLSPELVKQAQRASALGFYNQLLSGPPVDNQPMTVERAGVLFKRAHGYFKAREQRVSKVYTALAKA